MNKKIQRIFIIILCFFIKIMESIKWSFIDFINEFKPIHKKIIKNKGKISIKWETYLKETKNPKKTQKMISDDDQLKYRLAGIYLKDDINLKPIKDQIQENTNKIDQQENTINDHENKINNNINNISSNINNINNINTKINKITNDLNNANLANYKGLYNKSINYKLGDLVSENNTNNVYLSVQNNNINNPLNNNNFWKIITFTLDTSDYVQNSYLTDNYFNKQDTIQQINLKQHKPSYVKNIVINGNARVMKILSDLVNQWSLFWYPTNITIDIPTFSNLEPNKDYFLKIYALSFSSDGGVSKFTDYIYGKVYTSNSNGDLIIPRTEYFIQFGLRNKYIRDYNTDTDVRISAIVEILRIGK